MSKLKKVVVALTFSLMISALAGCSTHIHTVGNGGRGQATVEERQWYVLWGLVPINQVDSARMAADAKDYTVQTQQSGLDVLINMFTGIVTVGSRTVTVTK